MAHGCITFTPLCITYDRAHEIGNSASDSSHRNIIDIARTCVDATWQVWNCRTHKQVETAMKIERRTSFKAVIATRSRGKPKVPRTN